MNEKDEIANLRRELEELKSSLTTMEPGAVAPKGSDVADGGVIGDSDTVAGAPDVTPDAGAESAVAARTPRRRRRAVWAAALLIVVLVAGLLAFVTLRDGKLPPHVAFRVYGHNVTVDELNDEVDTLGALYGVQAPTDAAKLASFRKDVAKAYAVSLILDRAAAERNVVIADKAAKDVLTRYISEQFGDGSTAYDSFVQALGNAGTSENQVLTELKRQLALTKLFNDVVAKVAVSDEQVRSEFEARKASLASPETRNLRNIVVATKAQANQIRAKLDSGADFGALARQYSLDGSTKSKGGSLGSVAASTLDDAYAKAAFAAAKGTVFGPVETQYGWNIGFVDSITPSSPAIFDKVKADVKEQLLLKAQLDVWREWLSDRIRTAHVRYADAYRPSDPNAAPTGGAGQPQPAATQQGASAAPPSPSPTVK